VEDGGRQKDKSNAVEPLEEKNPGDDLRRSDKRSFQETMLGLGRYIEDAEEVPYEKAEAGEGKCPIEGNPLVSRNRDDCQTEVYGSRNGCGNCSEAHATTPPPDARVAKTVEALSIERVTKGLAVALCMTKVRAGWTLRQDYI